MGLRRRRSVGRYSVGGIIGRTATFLVCNSLQSAFHSAFQSATVCNSDLTSLHSDHSTDLTQMPKLILVLILLPRLLVLLRIIIIIIYLLLQPCSLLFYFAS